MADSPESLFRQALEALGAEDWHRLADLCDPASLERFRRQLLQQYTADPSQYAWSVDDYMRHDPQMPRDVAEYHVRLARDHADIGRRLKEDLPRVASLDHLLEMSGRDVYAEWIYGRSPQAQVELAVSKGSVSRQAADRALEHGNAAPPIVYIGVVHDGDRIAHVVHRFGGPTDDSVERGSGVADDEVSRLERELAIRGFAQTTTCRLQADGTWRLIADYDLLGRGAFVTVVSESD